MELYSLTNGVRNGQLNRLRRITRAGHLRHIIAARQAERSNAVRAGGDALAANADNRTGKRRTILVGHNKLYGLKDLAGQLDCERRSDPNRL